MNDHEPNHRHQRGRGGDGMTDTACRWDGRERGREAPVAAFRVEVGPESTGALEGAQIVNGDVR